MNTLILLATALSLYKFFISWLTTERSFVLTIANAINNGCDFMLGGGSTLFSLASTAFEWSTIGLMLADLCLIPK